MVVDGEVIVNRKEIGLRMVVVKEPMWSSVKPDK